MHEMQSVLTDVHGVCLSPGSSRLHCAKTAEQIKMRFGLYTPGAQWNVVLDGGANTPERGRGKRTQNGPKG